MWSCDHLNTLEEQTLAWCLARRKTSKPTLPSCSFNATEEQQSVHAHRDASRVSKWCTPDGAHTPTQLLYTSYPDSTKGLVRVSQIDVVTRFTMCSDLDDIESHHESHLWFIAP